MAGMRTYKDVIIPIVLHYEEPGYFDATMKCLKASKLDDSAIIVSREGVGSMSKAFNAGVRQIELKEWQYLLWITNVEFSPNLPAQMLEQLKADKSIGAVHATHKSDHIHLQSKKYRDVPFIELTMAMFNPNALEKVGLMDENMPYWGMDLDWSYRARESGFKLAVSGAPEIKHTYLRHANQFKAQSMRQKYQISIIREILRKHRDQQTVNALINKYGANWKQKIWQIK